MTDGTPQTRSKRDLTSGSLTWNLFRLGAPLAAQTFLHSLYNLADAFWLGRWSKTALASQAVCWPFFFVVFGLVISFGNAGTALVSQYTGAGRERRADQAAAQTVLLLALLGLAAAVPMWLFTRQIFHLVRVPERAVSGAVTYLRISLLAFPLMGFTIAYASCLRALGDTVTVLLISLVANVLNIALDPVLIHGWLGMPALGTGGAAVASLSARVVEVFVCYAFLQRGRAGLHIRLPDLKPHWPTLARMGKVGFPLAVNRSSDSLGFVLFQTMVNVLGTTVIGAFTVGFRIIFFFTIPARAGAMAAAPIVGQALGAKKPRLARRAVRLCAGLVAAVLLLPLLFLLLHGKAVAGLFVEDAAVVAEAGRFFKVVPASSYFFGVIMVLMAAFYGSGHTTPAMIIGFVRLWVLRLPVAYVLAFVMAWGSMGIYTAMVAANIVCAVLAFAMFKQGGWQKAVVPTGPEEEPQIDADERG
ncbi:MAG: MATE family efflux transporter [Candidatus Brocadiia bacterium]